jgi:hypothetical protein
MADWVITALSGAGSVLGIFATIHGIYKEKPRRAKLYFVVALISFVAFAISLRKDKAEYRRPEVTTTPPTETQDQHTVKQNETRRQEGQPSRPGAVPGGAEIASVGPISPKGWQRIAIKGAHFAMGQPFNGCSDFIRVTDVTDNRVFGPFAPGRFCYAPIFVSSWTDAEIVIEAFSSFKQGQDAFKVGDVIKIEVANLTQEGWVTSGVNFRGAPVAWCSVRVIPPQ